MAKKSSKKQTKHKLNIFARNKIYGLIFLFLGVLIFAGKNSVFGNFLSPFLKDIFGIYSDFIFSPVLVGLGFLVFVDKIHWSSTRFTGLLLYWVSLTSLFGFSVTSYDALLDISPLFIKYFDKFPSFLLIFGAFLLSLYILFRISYSKIIRKVTDKIPEVTAKVVKDQASQITKELSKGKSKKEKVQKEGEIKETKKEHNDEIKKLSEQIENLQKEAEKNKNQLTLKPIPEGLKKVEIEKKPFIDFFGKKEEKKQETKEDKTGTSIKKVNFGTWDYPSTELLAKIDTDFTYDKNLVEQKMLEIQKTLLQFKIEVEMVNYQVGPTVTQYRLKPAEGVKLNKIENLKKDLSLALKAKSIFIQAPIPGMGLVGIEVPNEDRRMVTIREVIESKDFQSHKSNLACVVGKNINGGYVVADLAKMPHLLIAGQTGSGKSVGMNGFLISLLYKNSPETLRLIMVDPKRVELSVYNGIPHLLTPVINEPDKALNALKWGVAEMVRRYEMLTQVRARNLEEYNEKMSNKKDRLPNIVIVIDELADLMLSGNKKEVENAITRIAQMARAVGMHLIVATQRPSVDVITGLIKANIPSRIAFTVASQVDSRTILDKIGAEDLLGKGDLFYFPSGAMAMDRVQGVFVSTEEVESVVNHIKMTIDPNMLEEIYDKSIVKGEESNNFSGSISGEGLGGDEDSAVVEQAILIVRESGKASTSLLQRKLKLGYARAARVMDILEEMGIVGPADGSKPRQVL